jgi:hypothetical protein
MKSRLLNSVVVPLFFILAILVSTGTFGYFAFFATPPEKAQEYPISPRPSAGFILPYSLDSYQLHFSLLQPLQSNQEVPSCSASYTARLHDELDCVYYLCSSTASYTKVEANLQVTRFSCNTSYPIRAISEDDVPHPIFISVDDSNLLSLPTQVKIGLKQEIWRDIFHANLVAAACFLVLTLAANLALVAHVNWLAFQHQDEVDVKV